jgi:GNAT superfamily N-acetyltransferase
MDPFNRKPNARKTSIERNMTAAHVRFTCATRKDAVLVHHITQAAYAEYRGVLEPPSGVNRKGVVDVERALNEGGAVLAWIGDTAVGTVRYHHATDHLAVERLAVIHTARGQGIARMLLAWLEELARQSQLLIIDSASASGLPMSAAMRAMREKTIELAETQGMAAVADWP